MNTLRTDIDQDDEDRKRRKRHIWLSLFGILFVIGAISYFAARSYLFDGIPTLPDKSVMWEMNLEPNTTLLDRDGKVIGHRGPYVGRPLKLYEMPKHLPAAFLAIEDERFYEHEGVDRRAILRALRANAKEGGKTQGGSTLTQQLVKNMLLTPEKKYRRKFQEMWLARDLEQTLSKDEILELYLNRITLGTRTFGVEAASQRFFGKRASEVTLSEAALLAALPKAPSRLDPARNFDGAWLRAKLVLSRMVANDIITLDQQIEAEANPPLIIASEASELSDAQIGYVFDLVEDEAERLTGGKQKDLVITTTIDPALQNIAHAALLKVLDKEGKSKKVSEGALVALDNETGAILSLVGGRDWNASKFNRATQAQRQPGSSFKPFVYAGALEMGFTPGTVRMDQPTTIGKWEPKNYTKRYRGPMTVREALKLSINTIAAQIGTEIGPTKVAEIGRRFGIETALRPHYSISLGSSEVNLRELTAAYSVFANEGLRRRPFLIAEIKNTADETIYKRYNASPERVYAVPYARQMTSMLRDVIDTGTGHGAQLGKRPAAGKTGTSQDYRDAWFVGFTNQMTTGVWVGNDDNSSMVEITGGLLPVDIWKDFMRKAHKGKPVEPLKAPDFSVDDPKTRALIAFYESLTDAFTNERNMAAGINAGRSGGR